MKTTLIAAMAVLGMVLVGLAFIAPTPIHAAATSGFRTSATDTEGDGGSNPYASPLPVRRMAAPTSPV